MALAALILLSCQPAYSAECTTKQQETLDKLDDAQWSVLYHAYDTGAEHDLGHTMMAIAFKESSAGKYRVNLNTHDFGVMQNNIKTAKARRGVTGYYATMALVSDIVRNDQLSMDLALEELLYWRDDRKLSWRNTVSAYNNGNAYNKGTQHLDEMIPLVRMFMNCVELEMFTKEDNIKDENDVGDLVKSFNSNHVVGFDLVSNHNEVAGNSKETTSRSKDKGGLSRLWGRNKHESSNSKPLA